jgi:hypothetical protein
MTRNLKTNLKFKLGRLELGVGSGPWAGLPVTVRRAEVTVAAAQVTWRRVRAGGAGAA